MIPISYNARSLLVRKATTAATALGIGLVVFVLASAMMLANGVTKTMVSSGHPDMAIVLRKGSDTEIASSIEIPTVNLILAAPGVKRDSAGAALGSPEVAVVIAMDKVGTEGQISNVMIRGVTPAAAKVRPEVSVIEGRPPQPGTDEVMVGKGIVGNFPGMELGGSFELKKNRPVKVVGIFEAEGTALESEVWADIDTTRSSFGRDGLVSSVLVKLESPSKFDAFKATMESDKQLGLDAVLEPAYYQRHSEGMSTFVSAMGWIISVFFGIGAALGATITMHAAVAQRQREIGTLRALGFSRFSILISFVLEAFLLALIGGAVGLVAALALGTTKVSMVNWATFQEVSFSFDPNPAVLGIALIAGAVLGVGGGLIPAIRAARVSPIEAMRA